MDRLAVRFPSLMRHAFRVVLGWPSLLGRDALIGYTYRRAYAAFNRRDWELNTLLHDRRDYVLRAGGMRLLNPDAKEEYRGIDDYIEANLQFESGWRELKVRFDGYVEAEPGVLVALIAFVAVADQSGIHLDQSGADIHRFRDGYLVSQTFYWDRAAGLRSVGIQAPAPRR